MNGVHQLYARDLFQHFGYAATWTPENVLRLGDIGVFHDCVFTRHSSLNPIGITFGIRKGTHESSIQYTSGNGVSVLFKAAGAPCPAGTSLDQSKAGIVVEFARRGSVVFDAIACRTSSIEDQVALRKDVLRKFRGGEWNKDWAVITELVESGSATILIASQRGARIELIANGTVAPGLSSLAEMSAQYSVGFSKNLQTSVVSKSDLTPLFRARKLRSAIPPLSSFPNSVRIETLDVLTPKASLDEIFFGIADPLETVTVIGPPVVE